ncbi:MAG: GGDEF domain-containing phosphodiesterase [Sulfurovum sp.]|nr:GGDEF domain-containing phosphodiesterase [Sulfurovum sp.]
MTSSIGISRYPKEGKNTQSLIDNAYCALYEGQAKGESTIEIFHQDHDNMDIDTHKMAKEIKKGLIKSEFELYYQPIYDLSTESIVEVEALLRWNHPKHGLISSDKFIDTAHKSGLILELGEYAFTEAIVQCAGLVKNVSDGFKITINFSLKEIDIGALLSKLEPIFEKYHVARSMVGWDISESEALNNMNKVAHDTKLLKEFGFSLALDHFGAEYSSFKSLSLLPIDTVKIDRSLIFDLTLDHTYKVTVQAIITMAQTLEYKVCAKGVETAKEVSILSLLACDYAQGYFYSRAIDAKALDVLLEA